MSWGAWVFVLLLMAGVGVAAGHYGRGTPSNVARKTVHRLDTYTSRRTVSLSQYDRRVQDDLDQHQRARLRDALIDYLNRAQPGDREVAAVAAAVLAQEGGK